MYLWRLMIDSPICTHLWQHKVTPHITISWREGNWTSRGAQLKIGEHPAFVVSKFSYFVGSGGAATVVGDGTDGSVVAASEDWEGLALGLGDVLDW